MSSRKHSPSEEEIDEAAIAQADDDSAWGEPVKVSPAKSMALAIPPDLVVRAASCARMSRAASVGEWLRRVIRERIEFEEAALARPGRSRESEAPGEDVPAPGRGMSIPPDERTTPRRG
jgi:hypothetical protein